MRILVVVSKADGGVGRYVFSAAHELSERGHDVRVLASPELAGQFSWSDRGLAFSTHADLRMRSAGQVRRGARLLRAAARDVDVVFANGSRIAAVACLACRRPVVAAWHNAPVTRGTHRLRHHLADAVTARRAAVVMGASSDLVARARKLGAKQTRLLTVVSPRLPELLERPARDVAVDIGRRPQVLCVARLAKQKRLDVLVSAAAGWSVESGPLVTVVGDGPELANLQLLAQQTGAPVEFVGRREDVGELLSRADVFVLTSEWEARPLVVQEALAAGVPVVATSVGGIPELVGDCALLVPPGDPAAVRGALERLLADPALARSLSETGRARAAQLLDEGSIGTAEDALVRAASN